MDFLQSLGQGLRIAAGGLNENVYNEQNRQDEIAQKTRQAQLAAQGEKRDAQITYLKQAVENGSMSLEDATKAASSIGGNLPIGLGASLAAQHAKQLVTNEKQGLLDKKKALGEQNALRLDTAQVFAPPQTAVPLTPAEEASATQTAVPISTATMVTDSSGRQRRVTPEELSAMQTEQLVSRGDKAFVEKAAENRFPPTPEQVIANKDRESRNAETASRNAQVAEDRTARRDAAAAVLADKKASAEEKAIAAAQTLKQGVITGMGRGQITDGTIALEKEYPELSKAEVSRRVAESIRLNKSAAEQQIARDKLAGFEGTILSNLEQLTQEVKAMKDKNVWDVPLLNKFQIALDQFRGIPSDEAVRIYGKEVANELAKISSSATATGSGGTQAERDTWDEFFKSSKGLSQMENSIRAARNAAIMRVNNADRVKEETTNKIQSLWPSQFDPKQSSAIAPPPPPPAGGTQVFASKSDLQVAITSGKIKKGDTFNDPAGNSHVVQ